MNWWRYWKCEKGGLDFIQVITAIVIITIAAVSTTYSIYVGRLSLEDELQEKQAIRYAQEEMEYWVGRVFVTQITGQEYVGDTQTGRRVLIDPRNPNVANDNVWGRVYYNRIIPVNLLITGEEITDYYQLHVWVKWPDEREVPEAHKRRVDLYSSMIRMD
jgi:hypothetical protein